jgi:hypothetical protein
MYIVVEIVWDEGLGLEGSCSFFLFGVRWGDEVVEFGEFPSWDGLELGGEPFLMGNGREGSGWIPRTSTLFSPSPLLPFFSFIWNVR